MTKIYLINYTDTTDNGKGTICASQQPVRYITDATKDCIKEWLQASEAGGTDEEINLTIGELKGTGFTTYGDYEVYVEETFIY